MSISKFIYLLQSGVLYILKSKILEIQNKIFANLGYIDLLFTGRKTQRMKRYAT